MAATELKARVAIERSKVARCVNRSVVGAELRADRLYCKSCDEIKVPASLVVGRSFQTREEFGYKYSEVK